MNRCSTVFDVGTMVAWPLLSCLFFYSFGAFGAAADRRRKGRRPRDDSRTATHRCSVQEQERACANLYVCVYCVISGGLTWCGEWCTVVLTTWCSIGARGSRGY